MRRLAVVMPLIAGSAVLLVAAGAGIGAAAEGTCGKQPFKGTVSRTSASTRSGEHEEVDRKTKDFRSALVFDFGNRKNYTVYVSEGKLDPKALGSTLTAPSGKVW